MGKRYKTGTTNGIKQRLYSVYSFRTVKI